VDREKKSVQTELNENQRTLDSLNSQLSNKQNDIKQTSENLNSTIDEYELRQSGTKYTLHNPLYWEVRNFINSDKTDTKPYDEDSFNCANFAQEVNNNAENMGIRCAYVTLNLSGPDHALVAFNTTDRGLVYFEPQEDYEVKSLEIGKDYYADCVVPPSGYYYDKDPENVIQGFELYW
jgi:hypothetical protein